MIESNNHVQRRIALRCQFCRPGRESGDRIRRRLAETFYRAVRDELRILGISWSNAMLPHLTKKGATRRRTPRPFARFPLFGPPDSKAIRRFPICRFHITRLSVSYHDCGRLLEIIVARDDLILAWTRAADASLNVSSRDVGATQPRMRRITSSPHGGTAPVFHTARCSVGPRLARYPESSP
jgi:hypothetical protein